MSKTISVAYTITQRLSLAANRSLTSTSTAKLTPVGSIDQYGVLYGLGTVATGWPGADLGVLPLHSQCLSFTDGQMLGTRN
jgi:hypothetical protein